MRRLTLGLLLMALAAPTADAQIPLPFFKKKKKDPAAEAAAKKGPEEIAAPGAPKPAAPPAATTDSAAPAAQSGAAPAVAAQPVAAPATIDAQGQRIRTPEEEQALKNAIAQALAADQSADTSVAHIRERMARWTQVMLQDPSNVVAQSSLQQARDDLKAANERALATGKADQASRDVVAQRLNQAEIDIRAKNWTTAEQHLRFVLDQDSSNLRAKSLMSEMQKGRRLDDLKRQAMYLIPVLVILAAGLVAVVKFGAKYREDRQRKADEVAAKRAAVLQIVDGVGRGKLVTIDKDKPIFKIGAAMGAADAEKNDLVVSDSAQQVSRFHCTLVRKDGDYYLVDSSMNGTAVNGESLKRGDHHLLEDGDEITLAEVSRLKFLHT
ncbi:MAG: FHA domain-containing protein [Gemmatimonadales bacterium]|nr:FHA domain-containing protein [Gemmatimonadales bacterium]